VTVSPSGRDGEIEAFVVDRYLESLLARRPIDTEGVPPELESTARRLAGALPRYHPSFRFEEALASTLAAAAGQAGGMVIPFRSPGDGRAVVAPRPEPVRAPRPAVIGGLITSAALSIAGAAFVAWRINRSPGDPLARAARGVARARIV
jgi:hypothetical protein